MAGDIVLSAPSTEELPFLLAAAARSADDGYHRALAGQRTLTIVLGVAAFGLTAWDLAQLVLGLTGAVTGTPLR